MTAIFGEPLREAFGAIFPSKSLFLSMNIKSLLKLSKGKRPIHVGRTRICTFLDTASPRSTSACSRSPCPLSPSPPRTRSTLALGRTHAGSPPFGRPPLPVAGDELPPVGKEERQLQSPVSFPFSSSSGLWIYFFPPFFFLSDFLLPDLDTCSCFLL